MSAIDFREWKKEIIAGKIYYMAPPSPKHNKVMGNVHFEFKQYLKGRRCEAFIELGVHLENDFVIPDVAIICNQKVDDFEDFHGVPSLVVEILSTNDKIRKFAIYEKFGVLEYWIIDPKSNSIDQYILQNDKYVLSNVFRQLSQTEYHSLTQTEQSEYLQKIKPTIFPDLEIDIADIF